MRPLLAVLAATLLALTGCDDGDGGDGGDAVTTTSTASTTTTAAADERAAGECPLDEPVEEMGTAQVRAEPEGDLFFIEVVDHAVAPGACLEQVTFFFEEGVAGEPGYEVAYASPPFEDQGGRETGVVGDAFLRVVLLNGTTVDLSGEEPRETLTSQREPPPGAVVRDIAMVSDFEGVSEWVIGLDTRRPFRVEFSPDEPILTVDVFTG